MLWDTGAAHKERLRTAGSSHRLQTHIKDLFTQRIHLFFLHLISTFVLGRGVIRASPLAFVHFVSGFNAEGLNCCSGNHCLCFLASHCAWDINRAPLRQYGRFIFFSSSVRNEQRIGSGHLVVCVGGNGGTMCCFVSAESS